MSDIKLYPLIYLLTIFFIACDTERFTGFQHTADKLLQTTIVQGDVKNTFTHEGIAAALVQVGSMQGITDDSGIFKINYLMNPDEQQNKPLTISISAQKFYAKTEQKVILPLENYFHFLLERAAPIIDTTVVFKVDNFTQDTVQKYTCQAIVRDYQGASTISSVVALMQFKAPGSKPFKRSIYLERVRNTSVLSSYWQAEFTEKTGLDLIPRFWIVATDNEQFSDSLFYYNTDITDLPIF